MSPYGRPLPGSASLTRPRPTGFAFRPCASSGRVAPTRQATNTEDKPRTTNAAPQSDDVRYEVTRYLDDSRAIYAQVIDDALEITDASLTGGRHYIIEPRVSEQELAPLVLDYIVKAADLGGRCPMCSY